MWYFSKKGVALRCRDCVVQRKVAIVCVALDRNSVVLPYESVVGFADRCGIGETVVNCSDGHVDTRS